MRSLDIFRRYDVVLCDIDGVLHLGKQQIAGVPAWLEALERDGPHLYFLTNNGTALPEQILAYLAGLGIHIDSERLLTAGQVLEEALPQRGLAGRPILSIGNAAAAEYVRRAGGEVIASADARRRYPEAAAVVVGSSRGLDKDVIDASCNAVYTHHVPVLCTNPDVFTPTGDGEITLVAGALARMFERELSAEVQYLGKPHRPIFEMALHRVQHATPLNAPRVLVVDDNVDSGIRGGAAMGFDTMLVLSGWHRSRQEAEAAMKRRGIEPTYVLESVVG